MAIFLPMFIFRFPVNTGISSDVKLDAFRIVRWAEIEIGGYLIDRIYGDWMNVWGEVSLRKTSNQRDRLESCLNTHGGLSEHLYIPLLFWFHRTPGSRHSPGCPPVSRC